jgi:hypothetical protein
MLSYISSYIIVAYAERYKVQGVRSMASNLKLGEKSILVASSIPAGCEKYSFTTGPPQKIGG